MSLKFISFTVSTLILSSCCNQDSIPTLINKLSSSDTRERSKSAWELAKCGEKARNAVPQLTEMLYDSNAGVQSAASYALRKIDTAEARQAISQARK